MTKWSRLTHCVHDGALARCSQQAFVSALEVSCGFGNQTFAIERHRSEHLTLMACGLRRMDSTGWPVGKPNIRQGEYEHESNHQRRSSLPGFFGPNPAPNSEVTSLARDVRLRTRRRARSAAADCVTSPGVPATRRARKNAKGWFVALLSPRASRRSLSHQVARVPRVLLGGCDKDRSRQQAAYGSPSLLRLVFFGLTIFGYANQRDEHES
jgi:hypothetical protein